MKRITSVLLCFALMLCFAGCRNNNDILLSSDFSSSAQVTVTDSSDVVTSASSSQESVSSVANSSVNTPTNTPSNDTSSVASKSSSSDSAPMETSKPQQTVVADDPNTITAPNGDKIALSITSGKTPKVIVKVNGKEIFNCSDFSDYAIQYDFEKDFTNEILQEYSDESILWAYRFNWGVVYTHSRDGRTVFYASAKHDYLKDYYRKYSLNILIEQWNLIELSKEDEYNNKCFAEAAFESIYKTTDYTCTQIDDLKTAGYSFEDYYDLHNMEFGHSSTDFFVFTLKDEKEPFVIFGIESMSFYMLCQEIGSESSKLVQYAFVDGEYIYQAV